MAKRPIVVDTTIDSPLAALGVNFAKDVPKPKASALGLFVPKFALRFQKRIRGLTSPGSLGQHEINYPILNPFI